MDGWVDTTLGEVTILNYGKSLPAKRRIPGSVPVYGSNGIVGWHNKPIVHTPGIIVGRKGSVGAVQISRQPFCPIDTTYFITADDSKINLDFLYYALLHLGLSRLVSDLVPGLNRERAYSEALTIPENEIEQKRIAHLLSTVQRAIEQQEQLISLTSELKKALMQRLFTEGTRGKPQEQTEIGSIPQSWNVVRLADIADSFQYGTSVKCNYEADGSPVLRIPNVVGGHLDVVDLKFGKPKRNEIKPLKLKHGDLLFVRTNDVKENAGRCSMYRGELGDDCYFASYLIRVRTPRDELLPEFLDEYSRTETGTSFLSGRAIRTADGKFNINSGTLQEMLIPVPDTTEQTDIARTATLLDQKLSGHLDQRRQFQELFRTLLHQLMTAQIRVNNLDQTELGLENSNAERQGVA